MSVEMFKHDVAIVVVDCEKSIANRFTVLNSHGQDL